MSEHCHDITPSFNGVPGGPNGESMIPPPTSRGRLSGGYDDFAGAMKTIDRIARADCNVLITGEHGAGLDAVVRALHDRSLRRGGAFVVLDCSTVPASNLEEEIFGRSDDMDAAHQGAIASAEGGTLHLGEIGELPSDVQDRLHHFVTHHEYSPVGEVRTHKGDVRVIASTGHELEGEVEAGRFREDLYASLGTIHVHVPTAAESQAPTSGIRPLLPEAGIDLRAAVEEFESDLICQALRKTGGNKNKAAQLLRVNRTTLVEMVKRKRLTVA